MDLITETSKSTSTSVILDKEIAAKVAHELLAISCVKFNVETPYTWVSGIQSPVYCDNRKITSYVDTRAIILDAFVKIIRTHFPDVGIIAGVATGGIPMGILIAAKLNLPFIYVRQAPKNHGLMRQVEGDYKSGDKVVLIEDHVSTGGSSLKAVDGLIDAKLDVLALFSIMTYNFKVAIEKFKDYPLKHVSLSDLDTVLQQAVSENSITNEHAESIIAFRNDPKSWKA